MKRNLLLLSLVATFVFLFASYTFAQCPEDTIDLGSCDTIGFHIDPMASTDTNELVVNYGQAGLPFYYWADDSLAGASLGTAMNYSCDMANITIDSVSYVGCDTLITKIGTKTFLMVGDTAFTVGIIPITEACVPPTGGAPALLYTLWISFDPGIAAATLTFILRIWEQSSFGALPESNQVRWEPVTSRVHMLKPGI